MSSLRNLSRAATLSGATLLLAGNAVLGASVHSVEPDGEEPLRIYNDTVQSSVRSCIPHPGIDLDVATIVRNGSKANLAVNALNHAGDTAEVLYRLQAESGLLSTDEAIEFSVPGGISTQDLLQLPLASQIEAGTYFCSIEAIADNGGRTKAFAVHADANGRLSLKRAKDVITESKAVSAVGIVETVREDLALMPSMQSGNLAEPALTPDVLGDSDEEDQAGAATTYTFTVSGKFSYEDWDNTYRPMVNCTIRIYDEDWDFDDCLATIITDWNGEYSATISSSDASGPDIYVEVSTENSSWVTTEDDDGYTWATSVHDNQTSDLDFGHLAIVEWRPAAWVFDAMNNAWNTAMNSGTSPGFVHAIWPGDGTYYSTFWEELNIDTGYASLPSTWGPDVVIHEWSHAHMDNAFDGDWPPNAGGPHTVEGESNVNLAWTEGFADFYPLTVDQDQQWDWNWTKTISRKLEHSSDMSWFDEGEAVEGRVAAALLDLWDNQNDELDQNGGDTVQLGQMLDALWDGPTDTWDQYWTKLQSQTSQNEESWGFWGIVQNTLTVATELTTDWAEYNDTGRTAEILSADSFYTNLTFGNASDRDIFKFWATAGQSYTLETYGDQYDSGADTRVRVFSSHRVKLADNDDGGEGLDSKLSFTPATTGYYYPVVTRAGGSYGSFAPYGLSIIEN